MTMEAVEETSDRDVTRRTHLAAERTWLAWWRSGIAAATAAVAVGGVVPDLVEGSRTPYVVLGAGYALLAAGVFAGAAIRRRQVDQALARGDYVGVGERGVLAVTLVAMALALGTLVVIIVEP
jgi:putative membrane protein